MLPTNFWNLFITSSPLGLRSSADMPSMPGALLLFNFCMASWISYFIGACIAIS